MLVKPIVPIGERHRWAPRRWERATSDTTASGAYDSATIRPLVAIQDRAGGTLHVGRPRALEDRERSCRLSHRRGPQ
jgi:hypothetical protein